MVDTGDFQIGIIKECYFYIFDIVVVEGSFIEIRSVYTPTNAENIIITCIAPLYRRIQG